MLAILRNLSHSLSARIRITLLNGTGVRAKIHMESRVGPLICNVILMSIIASFMKKTHLRFERLDFSSFCRRRSPSTQCSSVSPLLLLTLHLSVSVPWRSECAYAWYCWFQWTTEIFWRADKWRESLLFRSEQTC